MIARAVVVTIVSTWWCAFAAARELTSREFVAIALERNTDMVAARGHQTAAQASVMMTRSAILPGLSASAQAGVRGYLPDPTGDDSWSSYGWRATARQSMNVAGADVLAVRASRKGLEAADADTMAIRQAVALSATAAYYGYAMAMELVDVEREALGRAEQHLAVAEANVAAGRQASYASTRAAVSVAQERLALAQANGDVRSARIALDIAAGTELGDSLVMVDSLGAPAGQFERDSVLAAALAGSPALAAAHARERAAELRVRAAGAAFFPDIVFSADIGQSGRGADGLDADWGAGALVVAPLFAGGALRASYRQAGAALEIAKTSRSAIEQRIRADTERAISDQLASAEAIDAAVALVKQATEALAIAEQRFSAGLASPVEIADARAGLADARMSHVSALFSARMAQARILLLTGQL